MDDHFLFIFLGFFIAALIFVFCTDDDSWTRSQEQRYGILQGRPVQLHDVRELPDQTVKTGTFHF